MQRDIKKELESYQEEKVVLSANHEIKFQDKLFTELHQEKPKKNTFNWLSIAASVILLVSIGLHFYTNSNIEEDPKIETKEITLGTISPEFNTIETYYINSINLEISQLDLSDENKDLVDGYLLKIAELTKEYKSLTKELNTKGVNDATIDALIRNLQLRLQLLQRLKKQLKQLKNLNTKQNETQII
uniref:hypothetical protein n=1 Tax=uncultured Polaribacter sp. TaxID=174711 RepID=UPI002627B27D|nr:hypothetical protein [uncultured Polaribacter sp.]